MFKKILMATALLFSLSSFAAVDVNKANAADLDGIKGIGPSLSGKIFERAQQRQLQRLARPHAPCERHGRQKFGQAVSARLDCQRFRLSRRHVK